MLAPFGVDLWPQVDTIHSEPPTMGFAAGSTAASGGLADRICRICYIYTDNMCKKKINICNH